MSFHSQDGQDRFLQENVFKGFKNGFFVDVGAHDGISINNTLFFEKELNWTGVNIEPNLIPFNQLKINRPNCLNLNLAVDDVSEDVISEFYMNNGHTEMLSGLKNHYDNRHLNRLNRENEKHGSKTEICLIHTKSLRKIFEENMITHVNYLSVDVEGAEFAVIHSIDFEKVFIDVIGFEVNYQDVGQKITEYLKSKGYITISSGLDLIMIHQDSKFKI